MKETIIFILCLCPILMTGQITERADSGPFLLKDISIISPGSDTITGNILIQNGQISINSQDYKASDVEILNCTGLEAYPGLFDCGSTMGLYEVGSISLTEDYNENGNYNPQLKALTAVNPHSTHIPITRVEGVTNTLVVPEGGTIAGQAALISLYGNTPQHMYDNFEAVVINFPSQQKRHRWDRRSKDKIKEFYNKNIESLNDIIEEALLYAKIDSNNYANNIAKSYEELRLAELSRYLVNDLPIIIKANAAQDVISALEWAKNKDLKVIISGCRDCYHIADTLSTYHTPIIVGPVLSLPYRAYDRYDTPYRVAGKLHKAGIKIALKSEDRDNVRNLPYHAGFAAAYGLGKENALAAMTKNAAEILHVDDKYGTIENGKIANLIVTDGDPMETSTKIKYVFIRGKMIPLVSRQTDLYDQFLEREQAHESFYEKE